MASSNEKVAVITGGASGIGRAIAENFSSLGYKVLVGDIIFKDREKDREPVNARIDSVGVDLRQSEDCGLLINRALQLHGRIDVLCNNVGIRETTPLGKMEIEVWDSVMAVNLRSTVLCSKHAFPHLASSKGTIINISSRAGITARSGGSAYCVSKAAIIMLTKVLALEGAPLGIRVNCICPGAVDVGHFSAAHVSELARSIPIGRVGSPEEVASVAAFLVSDNAGYMTGSIISIDGGVAARAGQT